MKKLIAVAAALMLILSGCAKRSADSEYDREELSHVQFTDGDGNPGGKRIYKYYPNGLLADMSVNDSVGNSVLYESYTYDEDGNMTKKDIYSETEHEMHIYTYEKSLLVTEETTIEAVSGKNKASENEDAEYIESESHVPYSLSTYSYTSDSEKELVTVTDSEGNVTEMRRFIYDDEGRLKKERIFSGSESYLGGIEYTYGTSGDLPILKEYVGQASSVYSKEEMTYENGNLVKTVRYDKNGALCETVTIDYDSEGRRSVVTRINSDGSFDAVNNYYYEKYISLIG